MDESTHANDPYFKGARTWEHHKGTDVYNRKTWCPYCGHYGRDGICAYGTLWRTLKCSECGVTYKVK